jgi:hypothetical protein
MRRDGRTDGEAVKGLGVAFRKCFANAPTKGGIWRLNGRRRDGRPNKEGQKNSREEEENKKRIEVKEWKGQGNTNHVVLPTKKFRYKLEMLNMLGTICEFL